MKKIVFYSVASRNMKVSTKIAIYFLPIVFFITGCSQYSLSIGDEQVVGDGEVVVSLKQLDVHFQRAGTFSETYMVFGGSDLTQADTINKIWISGIDLDEAIAIHERYPDKCKSSGAALAQNALLDLDIIPADSEVLKSLRNAVSLHERNFANDGDRIFVKLGGEVLKMTRAIIREVDGDVTDQLPSQMRHDYYLVKSAEIIEAKTVFQDL